MASIEKAILEMDKKRKASEAEKEALNEKIFLLLPPKSVKNDYVEQKPAKYVFKCSDGDIQIPEYGIMRTEFYYQEGVKFKSGFPGLELFENDIGYNQLRTQFSLSDDALLYHFYNR